MRVIKQFLILVAMVIVLGSVSIADSLDICDFSVGYGPAIQISALEGLPNMYMALIGGATVRFLEGVSYKREDGSDAVRFNVIACPDKQYEFVMSNEPNYPAGTMYITYSPELDTVYVTSTTDDNPTKWVDGTCVHKAFLRLRAYYLKTNGLEDTIK